MQPYFFPYIGYFQLIAAVDKFIVYDDVNYIKGGWINRNRILLDHKESLFTIPLNNSSSFSKINTIEINQKLYLLWKKKFLKTLMQSYKKAPNFEKVFQLVEKILIINNETITISELSVKAIKEVVLYLNIKTVIIETSTIYNNSNLKSQDRVLDICRQVGCSHYINPVGGSVLYDKEVFKFKGIQLNFIKSSEIVYQQFNEEFVPWLSIIDVLMFNSVDEVRCILNKYELI